MIDETQIYLLALVALLAVAWLLVLLARRRSIPIHSVKWSALLVALLLLPVLSRALPAAGPLHDFLLKAAAAVGNVSMIDAEKWDVPTTPDLLRQLKESRHPLERQRAAWWLGEHEDFDAVWSLVDALRDSAPQVRVTAAWALGEIKDRKSIPDLIETLDDGEPLVREMAALALGEIEHPSAVLPLVAAFDRDLEVREAVLWALGEIGGEEAEQAREQAFRRLGRSVTENEEVWTGRLTLRLKSFGASSLRIDDLRAADSATRRATALELGYRGVHHRYTTAEEALAAIDGLLGALQDPDHEVRAAAVWALDEINPSRWIRQADPDHRKHHEAGRERADLEGATPTGHDATT